MQDRVFRCRSSRRSRSGLHSNVDPKWIRRSGESVWSRPHQRRSAVNNSGDRFPSSVFFALGSILRSGSVTSSSFGFLRKLVSGWPPGTDDREVVPSLEILPLLPWRASFGTSPLSVFALSFPERNQPNWSYVSLSLASPVILRLVFLVRSHHLLKFT